MLLLRFLGLLSVQLELPESLDGVRHIQQRQSTQLLIDLAAINVSLAFCMGSDLASLINSDQPMAQIFFNSFGQKPTLAIWSIVVIVQ